MPETAAGPLKVPPYLTLEAWRGFAALWVVAVHAKLTRAVEAAPASSPVDAVLLQGQLGVTIFFVISGYCIANAAVSARTRPGPLTHFLKARVRRIYPPYYFSIILWVGVSLVAALATRGQRGPSSLGRFDFVGHGPLFYLSTLTLTQVFFRQDMLIAIYWSLCYEIAFYGIVAVVLLPTLRARDAGPLLYLLDALTVSVLVWLNLAPGTCPFPLDLWPQFGLGVLVYHLAATPGKFGPRVFLALTAALTVSFATFHGTGGDFAHPSPRVQAGFCLAFALILIALQRLDLPLSRLAPVRLLAWVGAFSYSLYLSHFLVVTGLARLSRNLNAFSGLLFVVQIAGSVAFARLFFWYCERPFMGRGAAVNPVMPGRAGSAS